MELFFGFLFEIFEKIAMSAKTVFARNRVFEDEVFDWRQSERHVTAEENKKADGGKISTGVPHRGEADDGVKNGLTENDRA